MHTRPWMVIACGALAASSALAQGPANDRDRPGGPDRGADLVARMMAFDKDKDGSLAKAEVTDERLLRLFDRADANKDGAVTRKELADLAAAEPAGGPGGGPGGPGGGPGGPGGPRGGMMGPSVPGEVLSTAFRGALRLDAEQVKQVEALQKDVDARLAEILTDAQKGQIQRMKERGFGGPGGPGGPGGGRFGGPGGPGGPRGDGPPPPPRD